MKQGQKFKIEVSCFEIYCEDVWDLFVCVPNSLKITQDKSGQQVIQNLKWEEVSNSKQILKMISFAHSNKTFKTTVHNDWSSWAHTVFQIKIS